MDKRVRKGRLKSQIERRQARIAQMGIRAGCKVALGFKRETYEVLEITEDARLVVAGQAEPLSPLPVWSVE